MRKLTNNNRTQSRVKNYGSRTKNYAKQQHEKYLNQARDAQSSGDRVLAEKWYQYVDHYYRIMMTCASSHKNQNKEKTSSFKTIP